MHHPDQQHQVTPTEMTIPQLPIDTGAFDFFELLEPFQT